MSILQQARGDEPVVSKEHYTFKHVVNGEPVEFEFDFEGNQHDTNAKLFAAVTAWNDANPESRTSVETVCTNSWSISQAANPTSGTKLQNVETVSAPHYIFTHVVNGERVAIEFDYEGDVKDSKAKFARALEAWNKLHPEAQRTEEEVKSDRWSIFLPIERVPGTPTIF